MKNILMAFLVLSFFLSATAISAQEITTAGSIAGTVVDQNDAAIPGAKVTVSGPTGERTSVANDQGRFEISGLLPGNYKVTGEHSGFKKTNVSDVVVFVGKTANVRVKLEPGEVVAEVNVTAVENIDQASTAIGRFQVGLQYFFATPGCVLDLRRPILDKRVFVQNPEHRQHYGAKQTRFWHAQHLRSLYRKFRDQQPVDDQCVS